MEPTIKSLLDNVKQMLKKGILVPSYEIDYDSFVTFYYRNTQGGTLYYSGKMSEFPLEIQYVLVGCYMNDAIGAYRITGIYRIEEGY